MKKIIINIIIILPLFIIITGCALPGSNAKSSSPEEKELLESTDNKEINPKNNNNESEDSSTGEDNKSKPLEIIPDYKNILYFLKINYHMIIVSDYIKEIKTVVVLEM